MNVVHCCERFSLSCLPSEWVDEIWQNNFPEDSNFPEEYTAALDTDTNFYEDLLVCIGSLKTWFGNDSASTSTEKSLVNLVDSGLNYKALLCLINVLIKSSYEDQESRIVGLLASRLYIILLSLPGSISLNIYKFSIFQKIISTLAVAQVCKETKVPKNHTKVNNDSNLLDDDKYFILFETNRLLKDFPLCLKTLFSCFLIEDPSLEELVNVLVDLTRLEPYINVLTCSNLENGSPGLVAQKSYYILERLCLEELGAQHDTTLTVCKCFLPSLVLNEDDLKITQFEKNAIIKSSFTFFLKISSHINGRDDIYDALMSLVEQLCVRLPEREEFRSKVIPELTKFIKSLPSRLFNDILLWIGSLMHHDSVKHRLSSTEIISGLLHIADKISNDADTLYNNHLRRSSDNIDKISLDNNLLHRFLFTVILSGVCDSSSSVRSKCLGNLSKFLISTQTEIRSIIFEIFHTDNGLKTTGTHTDSCIFNFPKFYEGNPTSFPPNPLPAGSCLVKVIQTLTKDEKVAVRKNALAVLSNICLVNDKFMEPCVLKILVSHCSDVYVSVRKQTAQCLTDLLLSYPSRSDLVDAWVSGVLRLVVDNETRCSEKVASYMKTLILDNITCDEKVKGRGGDLPWRMLKSVAQQEMRPLLSAVCALWVQQGLIKDSLIKQLKGEIASEHSAQVWLLLYCLSEHQNIKDADFIYDFYMHHLYSRNEFSEYVALLVLEVLCLNSRKLSGEKKQNLYYSFRLVIESLKIPFQMIPRCMDFCLLYNKSETIIWSGAVVKKCETLLGQHLSNCGSGCGSGQLSEEELCRCVLTLGEALQFHPGITSQDLLRHLADFITALASRGEEGVKCGRAEALATLTLAKVCLQDHLTSKTYVPVLASLLINPSAPVNVKVNAMTALCDICRRFTSVVEDQLGEMCVCLRDKEQLVRKTSLSLVMALIQEDFLKIKTPLFFYLVMMLIDSSQEIRDMTDSFLVNNVITKHNHVMSHFFLQTIFFFNDFNDSEIYIFDYVTEMEKLVFSLAGETNLLLRRKLYCYMLIHMNDMERFQMLNKICIDILDRACDDKIPLKGCGKAVVEDALFTISSKEMRLKNLQVKNCTEKEEHSIFDLIAKQSFVSTILKKNYIENIIPILRKLHTKLVKAKSPLQADVMRCFRELLKDYKEEMNEILDDKLLASEIAEELNRRPQEEDSSRFEMSTRGGEEEVEVALKGLRVHCVRLTEDVLFQQYGIAPPSARASPLPLPGRSSFSGAVPSQGPSTSSHPPSSPTPVAGCSSSGAERSRGGIGRGRLKRRSSSRSLLDESSSASTSDSKRPALSQKINGVLESDLVGKDARIEALPEDSSETGKTSRSEEEKAAGGVFLRELSIPCLLEEDTLVRRYGLVPVGTSPRRASVPSTSFISPPSGGPSTSSSSITTPVAGCSSERRRSAVASLFRVPIVEVENSSEMDEMWDDSLLGLENARDGLSEEPPSTGEVKVPLSEEGAGLSLRELRIPCLQTPDALFREYGLALATSTPIRTSSLSKGCGRSSRTNPLKRRSSSPRRETSKSQYLGGFMNDLFLENKGGKKKS